MLSKLYSEKVLRKMAKDFLKPFNGNAKYKGFSIQIGENVTQLVVDFFLNPSLGWWNGLYCPGMCKAHIAI